MTQHDSQPTRIYLDNAATSWPKRESVVKAAVEFIKSCGATAGRGAYGSAQQADRWLSDARRQIAKLIGASDARSIAFTSSGTHSLNAALHGILEPGDHVIATEIEHNSVLRPLHQLRLNDQISVDFARCDSRGVADRNHAAELIRPNTKLIAIGHASNVTGAIQPLEPWSQLAKQTGKLLLVDASQTIGYVPLDVGKLGIDILAAAGHKGLGALAGTGFLYVSQDLQTNFKSLMTGGTGIQSESIDASITWPQSVEVGNYNLPGIVSMAVAARELCDELLLQPIPWQTHWREMYQRLLDGLATIPSVQIVGADTTDGAEPTVDHVALVSLRFQNWSSHDLAAVLDSTFGIEVRSGYHCAALVHRAIGTEAEGGTLRISPGHSTTAQEIDTLLDALRSIASAEL